MGFFNNFNTININYCCFNGLNNWFTAFTPYSRCGFGFGPSLFSSFFNFFPTTMEYPGLFMPAMPDFSNILPKPSWEIPSNNVWDTSQFKFETPQLKPQSLGFETSALNLSNTTWNTDFSSSLNTKVGDTFVHSTSKTLSAVKPKNIDFKTDVLKLDGYNAAAGKKLANLAWNNAHYQIDKNNRKITNNPKSPSKFNGDCARYVKVAIRDAGLGEYPDGHAYQLADALRKNNNFKEISPEGINVKELPAGCVLVYGKGVENYSKEYGHAELTLGNEKAVSDGTTKNLYKKPSAIFIPV